MSTPDPRIRISDSDRERAMADLAMHYTDGRLDHEEYDERLDAVWTARTRADLALLFDDLPRPAVSYPPVRPAGVSSRRGSRFPLLPVLALLVVLSVLFEAPLWLLVFPLMFFRTRHRAGCAPRTHTDHRPDYRRPRRSHGW
jgi:hypothetical protein